MLLSISVVAFRKFLQNPVYGYKTLLKLIAAYVPNITDL